jgi:hypothetical protein
MGLLIDNLQGMLIIISLNLCNDREGHCLV